MKKYVRQRHTGQTGELWPVLLLFLLVVIPTLGILWFVSVANRNERLAGRARLTDAYRSQLSLIRQQFDRHWRRLLEDAEHELQTNPPPHVFAQLATSCNLDGVVIYEVIGTPLYPSAQRVGEDREPRSLAWQVARRMEFELNRPAEAAESYASLARAAENNNEMAAALEAQTRCLLKIGRTQEAKGVVTGPLAASGLANARDADGRLIEPNTRLLLLDHLWRANDPSKDVIFRQLQARVNDYRGPEWASSQRLFLMNQMLRLAENEITFPTLKAEQLAASFVAAYPRRPPETAFTRSRLPGVWHVSSAAGRITFLCEQATINRVFQKLLTTDVEPLDHQIQLLAPDQPAGMNDLLSVDAGELNPGWRLSMSLADSDLFNSATAQQRAAYSWIAVLLVSTMAVLALCIVQTYRRQLRLTRLKNDLVGAVSHELKTPLASIRLLVDTLLDAKASDPVQTHEYLRLISKENLRLSRLIENFLTFSRMERGKQSFDMAPINVCDTVRRAVEAAGSRFETPECELTLDLPHGLPLVNADEDALVTVVLNLLDNAYKYSPSNRQIRVTCQAADSRVNIAVADQGIGMNRKAARRVFQQFFQVNQRLNRSTGGCGLGLSIVKYIVDAHGGSVEVASELNRGSTFVVSLPAALQHV